MPTYTDEHGEPLDLSEADRLESERKAVAFWLAIFGPMCGLFVLLAPAETWSGWRLAVVAGVATATVLYIGRLAVGPVRGERESFVSALFGVGQVAVGQLLIGDAQAPFMLLLLPISLLGASAVLTRRHRFVYTGTSMLAAVSPLAIPGAGLGDAIVAGALAFVLLLEAVLLFDFAARLVEQRHLIEMAEREASLNARQDELTTLGNRRALREHLAAVDPDRPLWLAYFDLDGFKPYNDRFGHAAGDALLRRLGRYLGDAVGTHGRAFRLGGDEFCAVVPGAPEDVPGLLDALVAALVESGPGYAVDASLGVAAMPLDAVDPDGALQVADQRMYLAKRERRARTASVASLPVGAGSRRIVSSA